MIFVNYLLAERRLFLTNRWFFRDQHDYIVCIKADVVFNSYFFKYDRNVSISAWIVSEKHIDPLWHVIDQWSGDIDSVCS